MIVLDGTSLTCADVTAAARRTARVAIAAEGSERARAAATVARTAAAAGAVYGRTTGVGANGASRSAAAIRARTACG